LKAGDQPPRNHLSEDRLTAYAIFLARDRVVVADEHMRLELRRGGFGRQGQGRGEIQLLRHDGRDREGRDKQQGNEADAGIAK